MRTNLFIVEIILAITFLSLPIISYADVVPWSTETYRAYAQEDVWYLTSDEQTGVILPLNASVYEECLGGYASADSQITSASMFVSAGGSSGGCGPNHSTAIAEFEGTYTATYSLFEFSYDFVSGNGVSGDISITNLSTSTVLLSQSFDSSDSIYITTSIGDDIRVRFDITSANCCNNGGAGTLNYSMAVVPEPISSTLFIVGGATLGLRRFRKKFKK